MATHPTKRAPRRSNNRMFQRIAGHAWTVLADARHRVRPRTPPSSVDWSLEVDDARMGSVSLRGRWSAVPNAPAAVLIVHGLGGSSGSGYALELACACARRGWSNLRIDLRGADGGGEDVYHAGLSSDLEAAIASPVFEGHDAIYVVGVSMGGHVTLRLGLRDVPRLRAIAAISAPLDLATSCRAIDGPRGWPYRQVVLGSLKQSYRELAATHPSRLPSALSRVLGVKTIEQWDAHVVVPRHGFNSVADYHHRMSIGPRLSALTVPALYLGSPHDPMVPGSTVLPSLRAASDSIRAVMLGRGGHVGLPAPQLYDDVPATWPDQVLAWCGRT